MWFALLPIATFALTHEDVVSLRELVVSVRLVVVSVVVGVNVVVEDWV